MPAPPRNLVAELTHRCPLRCAYCSNPVDLVRDELDLEAWSRVFRDAARLGVLHAHLTGGEPLLRRDLDALAAAARGADLYVNLVTSGARLDLARARALASAGVDHVQLSVHDRDVSDAGRAVVGAGLALTINVVLHRGNLDRVDALVADAMALRPQRLELACAVDLGHAHENRAAVIGDAAAIARARALALDARERHAAHTDVVWVGPAALDGRPRACLGGWASATIVIAPDGAALPCHAARTIAGLAFDDVRATPLEAIWERSPAFEAFRGDAWMPDPCRTCPDRARDRGGCRCRAFAVTGDATAIDPACDRSPHHDRVLSPPSDRIVALRRGPGSGG